MQEPKLPLYQIRYNHNFRKKQTNQKKDAALYSNLQLDLSRGLFTYALPPKFCNI
jgi:hypothetical protein